MGARSHPHIYLIDKVYYGAESVDHVKYIYRITRIHRRTCMKSLVALVLSLFMTAEAFAQTNPNAKIDLQLVATEEVLHVGDIVEVPLLASAQEPQRWLVSDIVFGWDPTKLKFINATHEGSHEFLWTGYSGVVKAEDDYTGTSEANPPADGDGIYYGYGELGQIWIITNPVQIVKFRFEVIAPFATTEVKLIPQVVHTYLAKTVVYGSFVGGMPVTGTLTNAILTGSIIGDFNNDGQVGAADMASLLTNWGIQTFGPNPHDLDGNGTVGSEDLAILLSNWS